MGPSLALGHKWSTLLAEQVCHIISDLLCVWGKVYSKKLQCKFFFPQCFKGFRWSQMCECFWAVAFDYCWGKMTAMLWKTPTPCQVKSSCEEKGMSGSNNNTNKSKDLTFLNWSHRWIHTESTYWYEGSYDMETHTWSWNAWRNSKFDMLEELHTQKQQTQRFIVGLDQWGTSSSSSEKIMTTQKPLRHILNQKPSSSLLSCIKTMGDDKESCSAQLKGKSSPLHIIVKDTG